MMDTKPAKKTVEPSGDVASDAHPPIEWPKKFDLFGVEVSSTTYDECERLILEAAKRHESALVTHLPVHGVVTAAQQHEYRYRINEFNIVAPDGQPVRWALKKFHQQDLPDRCYGPELMLRLCKRAAAEGVSVYLYGSTPDVIEALKNKLLALNPTLVIAGTESPPFRPLTPEETDAACQRINNSGAGLVFIGLGLPRQDIWAHENRHAIKAVQLCVGAAFDFHAGNKKMAPPWMQKNGLEWFFRLTQEPGRLWKRYLFTNTAFCWLVGRKMITGK